MKSQDIVILLKLFLWKDKKWKQRELAAALRISVAEVNHALKRLEAAKLYNPYTKQILKQSAVEFLLYGLKYIFPAKVGKIKKGIPTAHAVLADRIVFDPADVYVWPSPEGSVRGQSLDPLYRSVPEAVSDDEELFELLALVDAIRVGQKREVNMAKQRLSDKFLAA